MQTVNRGFYSRFCLALFASAALVACSNISEQPFVESRSQDEVELADEVADSFRQALLNNENCAELFSIRNQFVGDTSSYFDPKLREVGCFSARSERQVEAPVTTRGTPTTTLYSVDELMEYLRVRLVGTSYSIESPTTPFGQAQIETSSYFAEEVCRELRAGITETDVRIGIRQREWMGEPNLDRDIPTYVEAIVGAAKTFICP